MINLFIRDTFQPGISLINQYSVTPLAHMPVTVQNDIGHRIALQCDNAVCSTNRWVGRSFYGTLSKYLNLVFKYSLYGNTIFN